MKYDIPILYIPFKRLDIVKQVFPQIKSIKPSKLYIAQDGPRNEEEKKMLENVMDFIMDNIDWDVELNILKSDKNNGPNLFIYKAINWFFENEEMGIIIEEDGFPSKSFFEFAKTLLEKHEDDKEIYAICGSSGFSKNNITKCDYFYSKMFAPWAFATWKDRWSQFDFELKNVKSWDFINKVYNNEILTKLIYGYASAVSIGELKDKVSWDSRFQFNIQYYNGYCIFPRQNLVKHLCFYCSSADIYNESAFLTDIRDYMEIGEYDFTRLVKCKQDIVDKRAIDLMEKNILYSLASSKVSNELKNIIYNSEKIYIYGAGIFGYVLYNAYKDLLSSKLIAFIDDGKSGYLLDKKIISYNDINSGATILIGMTRTKHISDVLEKLKNYNGDVIILRDIIKEAIQ